MAERTSNAAARMYATIGKSVSGGCSGLPDQPRSPLNVRPRSVSVGRTENFLTRPLLDPPLGRHDSPASMTFDTRRVERSRPPPGPVAPRACRRTVMLGAMTDDTPA